MSNVAGLFIILAAGLAFGILTVIVELFIRAKELAKNDNVSCFLFWSNGKFSEVSSNKLSTNCVLP